MLLNHAICVCNQLQHIASNGRVTHRVVSRVAATRAADSVLGSTAVRRPLPVKTNTAHVTNINPLTVTSQLINPFSPTLFLTAAKMSLPKHSPPYWSNPPFLFFYIRALWCCARVPKLKKI